MNIRAILRRGFFVFAVLAFTIPLAKPLNAGELQGTYGTFKWTITGTTIKIEFHPKAGETVCSDIRLKQIYQAKQDGAVKTPSEITPNWGYRDDDHLPSCWVIDHVYCEKDSNYNGDDSQDVGTGGSVDGTTSTPTTMTDRPSSSQNNRVYEFETCAYCEDNGAWLGCITWKYEKDGTGAEQVTVTAAEVTEPSTNMLDAEEEFDDNHTKPDDTKFCPEKEADEAEGDGTKQTERGSEIILPLLSPSNMILLGMAFLFVAWLKLRKGGLSMNHLHNVLLLAFCVIIFISVGFLSFAQSDPISPYSDFISYVEDDYHYYQFKITYLGEQTKSTPSLGFHDTSYTTWDISRFEPYQYDEFNYDNDSQVMWKFDVQPHEMMWFVQEVGKDPNLTDTTFISEPFASFMILRDPNTASEKAFEGLMTQDELAELLYLLHESLDWSNTEGIDYVHMYRLIHWPRD